jgi:hypothetical protein
LLAAEDDAAESIDVRAPVVTRVADVERRPIHWLWHGYLPRGKLVILDGDPGLGKSTLTLDLAARVSAGLHMPDGSPLEHAEDVLLLSAEDRVDDVIGPRLDAAGADDRRVHHLQTVPFYVERDRVEGEWLDGSWCQREPVLPDDVSWIEDVVGRSAASLVVIDPLMAFLGGRVNTFRDSDVRRSLRPLSDVAERTGAVVLVVRHLNKTPGGSALYRGGGSIGFIAAARMGLLVAADHGDDSRRVLGVTKSNLGPMPSALSFRLTQTGEGDEVASKVAWEGTSPYSAEQLLAVGPADEEPGALADATYFLRAELGDGPKAVKDLKRAAQEAGLSWATIRRAQNGLRVIPKHVGRPGERQHWEWELSADSEGTHDADEGAQPPDMSTFGDG